MFRVELAYNTIKVEIENLEEKAKRKKMALRQADLELKSDKQRTFEYIKTQKEIKKDREQQEKELMKQK